MKITPKIAPLVLPLALSFAFPAFAQTPPAAGGSATGTAGTVMSPPQQSAAAPAATARTPQGKEIAAGAEHRITALHDKLKITQAEQGVWNDFADTMRQNASHADQVFQQQVPQDQQNALQSMKAYADITQAHAEDVQRLLPKFTALYDALSPAQKKAADDTFAQYRRQMMRNASHHAG